MTDWGLLTEDQREALWELKRHQPTMPWRRVARQLKVDPFSPCCQRRAREYVDKRRAEYLEMLQRQDERNYLDALIEHQDAYSKLFKKRTEIIVHIDEEQPFALALPADLHIGNPGTDLRTLFDHAEMMGAADGLYVGIGGDAHDNWSNNAITDYSHPVIPAGAELLVLRQYCETLRDRLRFMRSGNHDGWMSVLSGLDGMEWMARQVQVPYGSDMCMVRVQCHGAEYRVACAHKYKYSSSFNLTHTVKRLWEMGQWDFDIGVVEHQHVPAIEPFRKHGQEKVAIRPGTYKTRDAWAVKQGFSGAHIGVPVVYLWPGEHRIEWQASWDLERCLDRLGELRQ